MRVQLNGESIVLSQGINIETLLRQLNIDPQQVGIAVAVNRRVIPRPQWKHTILSDGDQIELVYARQGG
ncbi:MAG: sulfur carrier protein ThiS [Bacteroidia bacterium]|nr:sulfur carrier protein ThiS [Bacteroidia bacterium]MCX7652286.1 sulfur carrier protein ThiS [Bacteroidia bacterium]MDW8416548.1 sulfur carrier protein ThiS [Bacteroidia bacterium]